MAYQKQRLEQGEQVGNSRARVIGRECGYMARSEKERKKIRKGMNKKKANARRVE